MGPKLLGKRREGQVQRQRLPEPRVCGSAKVKGHERAPASGAPHQPFVRPREHQSGALDAPEGEIRHEPLKESQERIGIGEYAVVEDAVVGERGRRAEQGFAAREGDEREQHEAEDPAAGVGDLRAADAEGRSSHDREIDARSDGGEGARVHQRARRGGAQRGAQAELPPHERRERAEIPSHEAEGHGEHHRGDGEADEHGDGSFVLQRLRRDKVVAHGERGAVARVVRGVLVGRLGFRGDHGVPRGVLVEERDRRGRVRSAGERTLFFDARHGGPWDRRL